MDRIVYVLVTDAGGPSGIDENDKGGFIVGAFFEEDAAERSPKYPYCHIEKRVINVKEAKTCAFAKLNPIDRLFLDI